MRAMTGQRRGEDFDMVRSGRILNEADGPSPPPKGGQGLLLRSSRTFTGLLECELWDKSRA